MVKATLADRRSNALTSSSLRCLSHLPTINMTAGCVHGCAYCYIRGYSQYPGDDTVVVYRNTADQVAQELKRKKKRPIAVYFCPSSDAFMPVQEVLDQSFRTMQLLLSQGIGVQFVTKGAIPDRFFDLFSQRAELVAAQIGLTTLDEKLNKAIEPNTAPAQRRLADLGRLIEIGVTASLRADPLIHGVTDDDAGIDALFAEASSRGVRHVSASYLFLRPAIIGSLKRGIRDCELLKRILAPYEKLQRSPICGNGTGTGTHLPTDVRQAEFERIRTIASGYKLKLNICGCKNADLTTGRCHLTNLISTARSTKFKDDQPTLW